MADGSVQEGQSAPDFELPASNGQTVRLSSYKGKSHVVLCFYPKNHLFMCPSKKVFKMAKSVVSIYPQIQKDGAELFAISIDTQEDQKKFVSDYNIPYLHLSDTSKDTCKKYTGLNLAGLAKRSTFVIDKEGTVQKIFRDIDVEKHGQQILDSIRELRR